MKGLVCLLSTFLLTLSLKENNDASFHLAQIGIDWNIFFFFFFFFI